jgi:hypothetical protein
VTGADAVLLRQLARRLELDPSALVLAAVHAFALTEGTLAGR